MLFTVGSVACGLAADVAVPHAGPRLQGIGGAAMFATALALLASAFTGKDRGTAFGAFGATTGVSVAIGPVLGGVLTSGLSLALDLLRQHPDLRWSPCSSRSLKVQESHNPRAGSPDWVGFLSFSAALGRSSTA